MVMVRPPMIHASYEIVPGETCVLSLRIPRPLHTTTISYTPYNSTGYSAGNTRQPGLLVRYEQNRGCFRTAIQLAVSHAQQPW